MGNDRSYEEQEADFWREENANRSTEELVWEDAYKATINGLRRGDLLPLAAYLRLSFEVDEDVRLAVADAIEGKSLYRIICKKTRPGPGTETENVKFPNLALRDFYEEQKAAGVPVKQIEWEVLKRFGLKRSAMYDQLRF